MTTRTWKLLRITGLTATLALVGAGVLLLTLHVSTYSQLRAAPLIRVEPWVVGSAGAIFVALAALAIFGRRTAWVTFGGALALVMFALSLRTLEFDPLTVRMSEHWAGVLLSSVPLSALNDPGYCYETTPFEVRLKALRGGETLSYFRGVWPSAFSESVLHTALPVERCVK